MLAYQPVRSLTTLNLSVSTGLSAAKRIIPIIDTKNEIIESETKKKLDIKKLTNLNWKAKTNIDDGIKLTLDYFPKRKSSKYFTNLRLHNFIINFQINKRLNTFIDLIKGI